MKTCRVCGEEIPEHTSDPNRCRMTVESPHEHKGVYHADCYVKLLGGEVCRQCMGIGTGMGPGHGGSKHCESGSIASGGTRAHCTCDVCF